MTRSLADVLGALDLAEDGLSDAAISRKLGVSRERVRSWRSDAVIDIGRLVDRHSYKGPCNGNCNIYQSVPKPDYAYLLGLYLGDGHISEQKPGVFRIRIACDNHYPNLMDYCESALRRVLPANKVQRVAQEGCTAVSSYSKHLPCLFPQHGTGPKHKRRLLFQDWQLQIINQYPLELLRGLYHSDGCRARNVVKGKNYVRYTFSNASIDLLNLFSHVADLIGVGCKRMNERNLHISKRRDVELLDRLIGPKK